MNSFNGIGRIATEISLRYTPNGDAVCDFVVAFDNYGEKTSFIKVTCWRKLAENVAEYMEKGRQIGVSGELVQDKWENENGDKRSQVKINARNIKFLGGGQKQDNNSSQQSNNDIDVPF